MDADFVPITDEKLDVGLFSDQPKPLSRRGKRRKKSRPIENFNNIPLLKSVYDEDPDTEAQEEIEIGISDPHPEDNNVDGKEGFGDNMNAEEVASELFDIRYYLIDIMKKIHSFILLCEYNVAYIFTKTLSFGEFNTDDVQIIKPYVSWYMAICVSCYAVYNWFFIAFYRNEVDEKVMTLPSKLNRNTLKEMAMTNPFVNLSEPYMTYSVFFPEMLYTIFAEKIPAFVELLFTPSVSFVLLFYIIIYVFYHGAETFYNFAEDTLLYNTQNPWLIVIIIITVVLFLVEWVESLNININTIGRAPTKLLKNVVSKTPFVQIFYYILYFIYFCIILMITPFFGGLFCVYLILFASFCSLGLEIPENIGKIHSFINVTVKEKLDRPMDDSATLLQKITWWINKASVYLYKYVFQSALLFMLYYFFKDYTKHVKSDTLKITLFVLTVLVFFVFGVTVWLDFSKDNTDTEKTFEEKHDDLSH